jgi:hypothetical protein
LNLATETKYHEIALKHSVSYSDDFNFSLVTGPVKGKISVDSRIEYLLAKNKKSFAT